MSSSAQTCCGQPVRPLLFLSPVAPVDEEDVEEEEVDEEEEEDELVFGISICNVATHARAQAIARDNNMNADGGDSNCVTDDWIRLLI